MKYRLELLEPVYTQDRMGAKRVEYVVRRTAWAERVTATGHRSEEAGEHFPDYSTRFNIRSAHPIGENWRVRQVKGHLYTVTAIIPHADRGYNQLICERVNE
ncbi:MAG: head-tail adaptor protein [Muribaculaceae bacterium]|nr:head-tail adaptor protein [Muribaculaceae bacterium]